MITPIRGRKPIDFEIRYKTLPNGLEMITPIRGRKLNTSTALTISFCLD